MIALMPWFMTFILAKFAAGLVIYWTFNNLLSVIQQYIIMRSMGVEIHFFEKMKKGSDKEKIPKGEMTLGEKEEFIEEKVEEVIEKVVSKPKPKKKTKKKK